MKLPRSLTGALLARHLERTWEYIRVSQRCSHLKVRTETPSRHTAIIPMHNPVKLGTLDGIVSRIAEHKQVSVELLLDGL